MSPIDFGRHSEDYAAYRPGLPASFYERLDAIIAIDGSRSLDLGTGPGTLALELAARGSSVVGVDISPKQIAVAKRLSSERGLEELARFVVSGAESTGLDAGAFDLVTAGQCWHWFDSAGVMREVHRVLRPGGILAVTHNCYLAEQSQVARETEALILEFNPSWHMAGMNGLYPEELDDLVRGGFALVEQFSYRYNEKFSHARWRGRMRTCNGVGSGGLPPEEVKRFDDALHKLLRRKYPDPVTVEHRVWCAAVREPSGS